MLRLLDPRWVAAFVLAGGCAAERSTTPTSSADARAREHGTPESTFSGTGEVLPDTPSSERLMQRLRALMQTPRALGDPRRDAAITALEDALVEIGLSPVERIEHVGSDPATGDGYDLVNLVAHARPGAPRRFVLATHFDTRPWADEEPVDADRTHPVPGANDGTSGLAIVLELAPVLMRMLPTDVGMSVVLFDGEELGRPGHGGYCKGSRHVARSIAAGELPELARAELGIVLDMVGDAELDILIEPGSLKTHPSLVGHVWETAAAAGHAAFVRDVHPTSIMDDHTFLSEAGIPSILLIDYEYPPWHTRGDTEEHVSGRSMQIVADVVLRSILGWYASQRVPLGTARTP